MEKWIKKTKDGNRLVDYCLIDNRHFTVAQARARLEELEKISSPFIKCLAEPEIEQLKKELKEVQSCRI